MTDQTPGRPPAEQWWTINGQVLLDSLRRVLIGDEPDVIYLELCANSDATDYGDPPE